MVNETAVRYIQCIHKRLFDGINCFLSTRILRYRDGSVCSFARNSSAKNQFIKVVKIITKYMGESCRKMRNIVCNGDEQITRFITL